MESVLIKYTSSSIPEVANSVHPAIIYPPSGKVYCMLHPLYSESVNLPKVFVQIVSPNESVFTRYIPMGIGCLRQSMHPVMIYPPSNVCCTEYPTSDSVSP